MSTIKKAALAAIIITSFSSTVASASPPKKESNEIKFKGSIINSTCQVDQRSKNATVELNGVSIASLGTAEYTGTNFELYFTGCNANDKPKVTFSQLETNTGYIHLDSNASGSTTNVAQNVAIQLFNASGQPILATTTTDIHIPTNSTHGTLALYAKYVKIGSAENQVTPGVANAKTTFEVSYN